MTLCSICHRDLPIAVDQTDPTADELTVDARGVIRPGAYVCGACLDAAEDELAEASELAATVTDDGAEERQMTNTMPAELIEAMPRGISIDDCTITTCGALRVGFDVDVDECVDDGAPAILLPGWFANDGNAEVYYQDAESGEDAASEYVEGGEWGERTRTDWVDVWAWRRAYALDEDGAVVTLALDREWHTIELPPDEPDCSEGRAHDWHERGVRGHGGGVIITEVCAHCARYRIIDTWAQRRDTGEQGLQAVEYREADEISREWAEALRLED